MCWFFARLQRWKKLNLITKNDRSIATYSREQQERAWKSFYHWQPPLCKLPLSQGQIKDVFHSLTKYIVYPTVQGIVQMLLKYNSWNTSFLSFLCLPLSQNHQILGKHSESFPQLGQETLPGMNIGITHYFFRPVCILTQYTTKIITCNRYCWTCILPNQLW